VNRKPALGQAIADRRDRVQILTKVGLRWDDSHGQPLFEFVDAAGNKQAVRKDGRPHSLREEVQRSLRRLGVETIDLLQLHHPDRLTPLDDTLEALRVLQRSGGVRAIGLSNVTSADLRQAVAGRHPPVVSVQQEYSLLNRTVEADLLPAATAAGVGLLAYSPLARGVLAGRQLGNRPPPGDWRRTTSYFQPSTLDQVNAALELSRGRSPAPTRPPRPAVPGLGARPARRDRGDRRRRHARHRHRQRWRRRPVVRAVRRGAAPAGRAFARIDPDARWTAGRIALAAMFDRLRGR
jgi:aryl-alcohol dehydrogenase-like predicted oxidoreductase